MVNVLSEREGVGWQRPWQRPLWFPRRPCPLSAFATILEDAHTAFEERLEQVQDVRFVVLEVGTFAFETFTSRPASEFPKGRNNGGSYSKSIRLFMQLSDFIQFA